MLNFGTWCWLSRMVNFFFFFFLLTEVLDSFLLFISRFGDLIVLVRLWSGSLGMRGHLHIFIGSIDIHGANYVFGIFLGSKIEIRSWN